MSSLEKAVLQEYFKDKLPRHMRPQRLTIGDIAVGHRFKRL